MDLHNFASIARESRHLNLQNILNKISQKDDDLISNMFFNKYPLFLKPNYSLLQLIYRYIEINMQLDYFFESCLNEFMDEIL